MPNRPHLPVLSLPLALLVLFPAPVRGQLKDAQEKGWSTLKDGYALVVSMKDNKSDRTRDKFETSLGKIMTSMADMRPLIEKMGKGVADEDKSYAAGLQENILSAWKGVAETHQKLKTAYDGAKDSPEKMAEISDELDKLKAALEQYETACKAAYSNYKARWDELRSSAEKNLADLKSAQEKYDSLVKQENAIADELKSLAAEVAKLNDETKELDRTALQVFAKRQELNASLKGLLDKPDEFARAEADIGKTQDMTTQIIDMQIANVDKVNDLYAKKRRKNDELRKLSRDLKDAKDQMDKYVTAKPALRFNQWNAEFPAASYSFQGLR